MLDIDKARDILRIDGTDNDEIIQGLLDAVPDYLELTTGMSKEQQENEPMAETAAGFLIRLWYHAEQAEAEKLQRTINNLLKVLTLKANG